jgi:hypothetical protein
MIKYSDINDPEIQALADSDEFLMFLRERDCQDETVTISSSAIDNVANALWSKADKR